VPLIENHDHSQFEITCYAQVFKPDAMTDRFRGYADRWRDIVGISDEQVAEQIREDAIDILVDLGLHTTRNRLLVFARKPAPVQVTFAGYPGSTGLAVMDYRLSDPYLDPPGIADEKYSEKTVRLVDSFWCYDPLDCADIEVSALPALETCVVTFGCLNNFAKINDEILAVWAKVLGRVEGSRLVLLAPPPRLQGRILECLRLNGIDPGRIEFLGYRVRREYLQLYRRIDIGLDSFPYNGHTTSLDSLWMGVPVVTLVGERVVSRAGWSQLSNLGMRELAAETAEDFVKIAVELAWDLPRLAKIRLGLRERMERSPLMDAARFARNIEGAYREMWRNWCESNSVPA
jgi:predicted O-linked N-acetylglucosamine transferase (SPINDLY family)